MGQTFDQEMVRDDVEQVSVFWVQAMVAMMAIVTVQPILVTLFYDGNVQNDVTRRMTILDNWASSGQILFMQYTYPPKQLDRVKSSKIEFGK